MKKRGSVPGGVRCVGRYVPTKRVRCDQFERYDQRFGAFGAALRVITQKKPAVPF